MTEQQTAMMLTQQEWDDLAKMVEHYRECTQRVDRLSDDDLTVYDRMIVRHRALAERIIEANQ